MGGEWECVQCVWEGGKDLKPLAGAVEWLIARCLTAAHPHPHLQTQENPAVAATAPTGATSITISFDHNCDGGMQEYEAAKRAVLKACPGAWVAMHRTEWVRPIKVAVIHTNSSTVLWEGRQQSLFKKNVTEQAASMLEIETAVRLMATTSAPPLISRTSQP